MITRALNWRWVIAAAVAVVVAAALSALGAWRLARQERPGAVARVLVGVSPASQIARTLELPNARPFRSAIALSPDGQSLAFIGALPDGPKDASRPPAASVSAARTRARQLYLRRMDRLQATPIEGTERAESPFFSPDGQWVGFWQAGPDNLGHRRRRAEEGPARWRSGRDHLSDGAPGGYQLGAERPNHLREPRWRWSVAGGRRRRHAGGVDDT